MLSIFFALRLIEKRIKFFFTANKIDLDTYD